MRSTQASSFSKSFLLTCLLLFSLFSSCISFRRTSDDLPLFAPLNHWLYRGAQPTEEGFVQLKEKGIRTVVNFRNEPERIEWERAQVEGSGMHYVSLPWSVWRDVDPKLLDRFFETLDNPQDRPVFFHCKHGRDRTGAMSALALMRYKGLSEEEARQEALTKIKPHLRYRYLVSQKIGFFLKERASQFSEFPAGDRQT